MNQIFLFIMLYFLIQVFYDYKNEQNNIYLKYTYNNSETKIMSLLILEENNIYYFLSLYVLLNICIQFLENKNIIFYLLIIEYYFVKIFYYYHLILNLLLQNNIKLLIITYIIEIALVFIKYIL
jgi:hypothetical protein